MDEVWPMAARGKQAEDGARGQPHIIGSVALLGRGAARNHVDVQVC
jgi:hypothetical protein